MSVEWLEWQGEHPPPPPEPAPTEQGGNPPVSTLPESGWEEVVDSREGDARHLYLAVLLLWAPLAAWWFQVLWRGTRPRPDGARKRLNGIQLMLTMFPVTKLVTLGTAVGFLQTCFSEVTCQDFSRFLLLVGYILLESSTYMLFLSMSTGWCIITHTLCAAQKKRLVVVSAMLYGCLAGFYIGIPFFFTFLVMVYCITLAIICHNTLLNIRIIQSAYQTQNEILRHEAELGRDTAHLQEGTEILHKQFRILFNFRQMIIIYVIIQLVVHGPVYFSADSDVIVQLAGEEAVHLLLFVWLGSLLKGCFKGDFPNSLPPMPLIQLSEALTEQLVRRPIIPWWTADMSDKPGAMEALEKGKCVVGVSQPGINVEMDGTVAVADGEEGRVLVIVELPAALGPAAGDAAGAAAAEGGDSEGGEEDRWSTAVPGGAGGGGFRGDAAERPESASSREWLEIRIDGSGTPGQILPASDSEGSLDELCDRVLGAANEAGGPGAGADPGGGGGGRL